MSDENANKNTQNNGELCNQGIKVGRDKQGTYSIEYSGRIRMMTQEDYSKMMTQIKNLVSENDGLKKIVREKTDKLNLYKQQAREAISQREAAIADLQRQVRQLASEREQLMGRLARFEKNHHGRTPYKLTPEVKEFLNRYHKQFSISRLHLELTKRGVDISYESVRRYISSLV